MADPFVAEIRMFAGNFAPLGWAFCNGQLLPLAQNTALFSLLGTQYGGNGTSNFALPNLQGSAPMFWGQGPGLSNYAIGEVAGSSTVTLTSNELPVHSHTANGRAVDGTRTSPDGAVWAQARAGRNRDLMYAASSSATMGVTALAVAGGGAPHNNLSPYLAVSFIIALQGIYPSRS